MIFFQSEGTAARRRFWLYLVDAVDGITPETGEAAGQPQVSKNGAAFANTTATLTAVGNGTYYVELSAAELDTLGKVFVRYKSANTAEFSQPADVIALNVFDGVRAGLTALPNAAAEATGGLYTRGTGAGQINQAANGMIDTNPVRLNNVSQSLLDLKDFADDGYDPATNKVQGVVLTDTVTTYTGDTPQTGDAFARLGAPAGASVSADIAAIEAQTDDIGVAGAGLTAVPWNAAWDAEVESEATDALNAYDGPTNAELATALAAADDAVLAAIATVQADTDNIQTRLPAALVGGKMDSDVTSISGDAIAADNAEAFFDGTGYAGTGNVIPSVTTVTGNVNGSVASVAAGGITATSIATGAFDADALAADAATEIATAILATTLAELGVAAPAATPTLAQAVMLTYMAIRNKRTVTSTKDTLFNDAGTAIAHADLTDDGSTFTAAELASGA
jgi:hypothetical protein